MQEIKKIVVIGPESTGKSTLCQFLADHYHTLWCPEYAREYLLEHGMNYTYEDLLIIAKGQLALEETFKQRLKEQTGQENHDGKVSLLFVDTDMYVMKVWCEVAFGKCHPYILEQIAQQKTSLYLLCNTDLPWVKDELREYPDLKTREELYHIYKDILVNQPVPWIDISGGYEDRLKKATNAIDAMLLNAV